MVNAYWSLDIYALFWHLFVYESFDFSKELVLEDQQTYEKLRIF